MTLDWLHELEIIINVFAQGLGSWLKAPMQAFSFLGTENFYFFIMPALYWCIDARLGLRVGMILLLSNGLNSMLKLAFHTPRPYWVDARVTGFAAESSFGLPSGHAQQAASVWGLLASSFRKPAVRIALIILILCIGLSRIYLGVHFASDVLLGWAVGGLLLLAFLRLEKRVAAWVSRRSLNGLLAYIAVSSVLLVGLVVVFQASLGAWQVPAKWAEQALVKTGEAIDPLNLEGAFTLGGTWLGLLGGAAWLACRRGGLDTAGKPLQLVLRYLLGLAGVLVLWFGLGQVFPRGADWVSYALRYFRYVLIGVWISAAAPLLFFRLGWAKPMRKV